MRHPHKPDPPARRVNPLHPRPRHDALHRDVGRDAEDVFFAGLQQDFLRGCHGAAQGGEEEAGYFVADVGLGFGAGAGVEGAGFEVVGGDEVGGGVEVGRGRGDVGPVVDSAAVGVEAGEGEEVGGGWGGGRAG